MVYLYNHISTPTTTTVAGSGQGVLHAITVNWSAGAITAFDATGNIAVLKSGIAEGTYLLDIAWAGYLKVTTAGAADLTVSYKISQT